MTAGNDGRAGGEGELGPTMCFLYKDFESDLLMDEQMIALVVWSRWCVFELGAQRNLGSIQRKAMLAPFLSRNHPPPSLLVYVGEPPVVWQGTVDSYHRHLHSWDRGQLMAGGVRWQVRSPTPRRHLECLVTTGGLQVGVGSDLQTGEAKPSHLKCQVTVEVVHLLVRIHLIPI